MSTHNIGFYEEISKIIFELSSNTHIISSADANEIIFHYSPGIFLPFRTWGQGPLIFGKK